MTPPLTNHSNKHDGLFDSGASNHYLKKNAPCNNKKAIKNGPIVTLPGGDSMEPTHETSLNIPALSEAGNKAYVFPKLKSANLISVGQLCDDNCDILLNKNKCARLETTKSF